MPRGGGFRGGGGFGGGGFRGGGFRGGGMSRSFRSRSSRSRSSRPFGRTGARRTTSSRSRRYHHTSHRPHRRHYHRRHYHRPYYYRSWWYRPYFWGYHYRPWYYSPVYIGGGLILFMLLMMIALPILITGMSYPFGSGSEVVNYRSTETLYFNEYWYETEKLPAGSQITYSIQSNDAPVSFAIADHPFSEFSKAPLSDNVNDAFELNEDGYYFQSFYAVADSSFSFEYNASAGVEFFICNVDDFNDWLYYENPIFPVHSFLDTMVDIYTAEYSEDIYFVWYNENPITIDVEYSIDYTLEGNIDFGVETLSEPVLIESIYYEDETTITVSHEADWYFFVYFDPTASSEYSTTITFDVTFDKSNSLTDDDRWENLRPWLVLFAVLALIFIIATFSARKKQKKQGITAQSATNATSAATTTKANTTVVSKAPAIKKPEAGKLSSYGEKIDKCRRCGTSYHQKDIYCPSCGNKREGRTLVANKTTKVSKSRICSTCGTTVFSNSKFCSGCGSTIQK